jgi:glycosyltransferase involved in cell wall biosynthesis
MQRALPATGIILDVRGAWPEEFLFYRGFDGPAEADDDTLRGYHHHLANLHRAIEHAGAILSVSAGMLDWLRTLHVPDPWLTYVPCCVTDLTFDLERRRQARKQLEWDDALVFAYMGTVTPYQHIEDGVAPFFLAASQRCPDARLLCITDDPEAMRAEMVSAGVSLSAVRIERRPQAQVADLLVAADCGLILRAPTRINQFSQPTKLGEYLAAGVPVVVSHGTGRLGEMLETAGAGMSIDVFEVSPDELTAEAARVCATLREAHSSLRANALQLCRSSFQWASYVEPVRAAYKRALRHTVESDSLVVAEEPTLAAGTNA